MAEIRVDTDQVAQIATTIESLSTELTSSLTEGKATLDNLANTWEGDAATETIASFDEFANAYFQSYEDVLTQYVSFLRTCVEQGYFETETSNTSLADAFK